MIKYGYSLKRSARRSISVSVKDDNSLVVHAPLRMSVADIEKFLISKSGWIDAHMKRNGDKNAALSDVISYTNVLVAGEPVKLTVDAKNAFSPDGVYIKSFKSLKKLYVDNLGGRFMLIFNEIRRENNFKCGEVGFKDYKAKWGCCDSAGNITFNYKLLMLPENLWRYVAAHELCHTVHMNHSKNFYALLGRILPEYKKCRTELKRYSVITRMY